MNKIEFKNIFISKDNYNECFIIDGIPLHEHMLKSYQGFNIKKINANEITIVQDKEYKTSIIN